MPGRCALPVWCPERLAKGDGDRSPLRAEPRIPRALLTGPALTPPQTEGQLHSQGLFAVRGCVLCDKNRSWVVFGASLVVESLLQRRKSQLTWGQLWPGWSEQPSHPPARVGVPFRRVVSWRVSLQPGRGMRVRHTRRPCDNAAVTRRCPVPAAQVSCPGCAAFHGGPETINHSGLNVQSRTATWSPCPEQEMLDKICFELLT